MDKFPLLCMLSALIVFLGAALGVAGVQTGKSNDLPFGLNSVKQIQESFDSILRSSKLSESEALLGRLGATSPGIRSASVEAASVIRGEILVSF